MKVIILGNGNAGKYIYKYLSKKFKCKVFDRKYFDAVDTDFSFLKCINCDDVVINCIGILKPKIKDIGIKNTFIINSVFPNKVYDICKDKNAHFIHICSDCIFKGNKGGYIETDIPDATDIYALSKSLVNRGIILRTSFIGIYSGLLSWVISKKDKEIDGYDNCIWNGITALQLAKFISNLIHERNFSEKIIHLGCKNALSKYELCKLINVVYNLNIRINKISTECIEGTQINTVLDRSLKVKSEYVNLIPNINDQLIEMKKFDTYNI